MPRTAVRLEISEYGTGGTSVNAVKLWMAERSNQIGANPDQFAWPSEGLPPEGGLAGIPMEGGFGEDGADVKFSKAVWASRRMRSDLFSTNPKRRKGIAVAATKSLALRGTLASGSQRKSWQERKKVRHAQMESERIST